MTLQLDVDIEIKESPVSGKGVFAKRLIKKGETIFHWNPIVLTEAEAQKLPKEEREHYLDIEGDKFLWMQPPERYINHSCNTNTIVVGRSDVASRDIQSGEEITSDYLDTLTENFTCHCGADNCRGMSKHVK